MKYKNYSLEKALEYFTSGVLKPDTGGLIAVDSKGNFAYSFNSKGMYRGAADSEGFFEVKIWK
jgi:isoaspartyl peptidase/L-asparaginase-like protein (Ntn-hydrolase superfamily)